jgi:hypothetical protein
MRPLQKLAEYDTGLKRGMSVFHQRMMAKNLKDFSHLQDKADRSVLQNELIQTVGRDQLQRVRGEDLGTDQMGSTVAELGSISKMEAGRSKDRTHAVNSKLENRSNMYPEPPSESRSGNHSPRTILMREDETGLRAVPSFAIESGGQSFTNTIKT